MLRCDAGCQTARANESNEKVRGRFRVDKLPGPLNEAPSDVERVLDYATHKHDKKTPGCRRCSYLRVRPLNELVAHRRKVLAELQAVSAINPENAVRAIQEELTLIEAGLEALAPPPGSLPENEWN